MNVFGQTKRKSILGIRLPKHFFKWTALFLICFTVGFIVARLLTPAPQSQVLRGQYSLIHRGGQASSGESIVEKTDTSYIGVLIAIIAIALLIAFAYFRDKRRK